MTDGIELDPEYVAARRVLLDALTTLAPHGKAIVVVGAQAPSVARSPRPSSSASGANGQLPRLMVRSAGGLSQQCRVARRFTSEPTNDQTHQANDR